MFELRNFHSPPTELNKVNSLQNQNSMKKVTELKEGDYIAFGFNYNGGEPKEIVVTNITSLHEGGFIVHFLYGYKSLSEFIKYADVLAIGNADGKTRIKGWSGKFDLINTDHPLILEDAYPVGVAVKFN